MKTDSNEQNRNNLISDYESEVINGEMMINDSDRTENSEYINKKIDNMPFAAEKKCCETDNKQNLTCKSAAKRKCYLGRGYWNPLRFILSGINFGTHAQRHADCPYPEQLSEDVPVNKNESKEIKYRTAEGILKGYKYVPINSNGKVVLYFGGSHYPGAATIRNAALYAECGATIVHFDPRGFGKSMSMDKKGNRIFTRFSEKSMYKDAMDMYRYVVNEMHVKPENIILHGFSLGGALASRVAADIAEMNRIEDAELFKTQRRHLPQDMYLGGIVLQSPIDSNFNAAKRMVGIPVFDSFAGFLAWLGDGSFNTTSYMERLYRSDPNIPVFYIGGKSSDGDHLSIEITKIDKNPNARFTNTALNIYDGDHNAIMQADKEFVFELVRRGRKCDFAEVEKRIAKRN